MTLVRYMIYRPEDGKLGCLLYMTEKDARHRGLIEKSKWTVVMVRTAVTDHVARPDQVTIEPSSLAAALLLTAKA